MSCHETTINSTTTPFVPRQGQRPGSAVPRTPQTVLFSNRESRPRPPANISTSGSTSSQSEKGCDCTSLIAFTIVIGTILGLFYIRGSTQGTATGHGENWDTSGSFNVRTRPPPRANTCTTTECKDVVARIRLSIDKSFSPCQDFYQYACGNWIRQESSRLKDANDFNSTSTTELGALDKINVKRISRLIEGLTLPYHQHFLFRSSRNIRQKIKRFYDSCMKDKNLLFILDLLLTSGNDSTSTPKTFSRKALPEAEIKEWDWIMTQLHPLKSLPEYLKLSLVSEQDQELDIEARSTICTHCARELLPEGVASLFVLSHYLEDPLRDRSLKLLMESVWKTFKGMITPISSPWITDHVSGVNMTRSISEISMVSGFLMDILNSTHVEGIYANVVISDHFLRNLRSLIEAREKRKKEGEILDQFYLEFHKETTKATAFYMEILDTVFIPAGIVHTPVFHHSYPDVLKYAKLGWTVAHEFAHSLHSYVEGIVLEIPDEAPIPISESVVSPGTMKGYQKRSQCVVEQYNGLEISPHTSTNASDPGGDLDLPELLQPLRVNGTLTMKENIADILGIQIAFKSFQENAASSFQPIPGISEELSKEQIFFIASAQGRCQAYLDDETEAKQLKQQVSRDEHSPGSIRVLGSFRNFIEFSKAFNCPLGSTYNPEKKCTFFKS